MTEQEVFNTLSELEEYLYYRMQNPNGLDYWTLTELYNKARVMLERWHDMTGCKNEEEA